MQENERPGIFSIFRETTWITFSKSGKDRAEEGYNEDIYSHNCP